MDNNGKFTVVKEPPDGGWGYVIVAGMSGLFACTISMGSVFGLVFGDFIKNLGDETNGTAQIQSVFGTTVCLMGLVTNHMLTKYPMRASGLCGAVIYVSGAFGTIFADSIPTMIFTYSILQGIGFGIMSPIVFQCLNEYFTKKKSFANSLGQTIKMLVTLCLPYTMHFLLETYGYRGTVAVIAALSLHTIPAMLVIQPVEWHMKTTIIWEPEKKSPYIISNQFDQVQRSKPEEKGQITTHKKMRKAIVAFFDLSLLKDFRFINIILGIGFILMCENYFLFFMPLLLFDRGFSSNDVAFTLTIFYSIDLVSRIFQTTTMKLFQIKSRYLVAIGTIPVILSRFGFAFSSQYAVVLGVLCIMGAARCWVNVSLILTIAEYNPERFPGAYGLYMIDQSLMYLTFGPLIGFLSEVFQSTTLTVIVLAIIPMIVLLSWLIECLIVYYRDNKSYNLP